MMITSISKGSYKLSFFLFPACCRASYNLDQETSRIDALIQDVERAIDLLKEHRQSLISAAVTGQIDVREDAEEVPA